MAGLGNPTDIHWAFNGLGKLGHSTRYLFGILSIGS